MMDHHDEEHSNLPAVLALLGIGAFFGSGYTLLCVWWLS